MVTSVDFKKCDSKAATCAKLVCPKSKISQLAALIGQDASEKVKMQIHSVKSKEMIWRLLQNTHLVYTLGMIYIFSSKIKVCGNDGVTYESMCELRKATCTKGIQMSHPGPCVDLTKGL